MGPTSHRIPTVFACRVWASTCGGTIVDIVIGTLGLLAGAAAIGFGVQMRDAERALLPDDRWRQVRRGHSVSTAQ